MNSTSLQKRSAYLAVGGVGISCATAYLGMALQLPMGPLAQPGPGLFPVIAGGVLVLASFVTLLEGWRMGREERIELPVGPGRTRLLSLVGLLTGYFLLLPWLGHLISTMLFCASMMRVLSDRSWLAIVAYSLPIAIAIYLVFVVLLQVPMPRGVLGL
jgi:putative tricarboxylic transport membrane protein